MFTLILQKELVHEIRSKEILLSMFTFGLTVMLIFSFSMLGEPKVNHELAPGIFWSMIILSSTLGLHRLLGQEKDMDAFAMLLSAPIDRGTIFLAKWISNSIFLLVLQILIIIPFFLFFGLARPIEYLTGLGILVMGDLGISAVGVTVAGLAIRAKLSGIILPVLLFPLLTPLLISCVKTTQGWYHVSSFSQWNFWGLIMITYVIIFGLAGYLFFEHITEE